MASCNSTRAKTAIVEAFKSLVVSCNYQDFHVADVIARADVSRSTFYEHFRNKDDLMRACLSDIIAALAAAGFGDSDLRCLAGLLAHFKEVGDVARVFLQGQTSQLLLTELDAAIVEKLAGGAAQRIPLDLVVRQIAESTIGLIRAWLNNPRDVSPTEIAEQIDRSVRALRQLHSHRV